MSLWKLIGYKLKIFAAIFVRGARGKRIARLVTGMDSEDPGERQKAVADLKDQWFDLAVPALIETLDEGTDRQKTASLECLRDITGQDFGMDAGKWSEWWSTNEEGF